MVHARFPPRPDQRVLIIPHCLASASILRWFMNQDTNWRVLPEGFPTERLCITRFWRIMSAAAPFINRHFLFSSHILWLLSHPRTLAALERSRLGPLLPINSSLIFSTHLHCHYPATHLHSYICVSCVHIKGFGFLRNFTFLISLSFPTTSSSHYDLSPSNLTLPIFTPSQWRRKTCVFPSFRKQDQLSIGETLH